MPQTSVPVRLSVRLYRLLLTVYPRSFRREFGEPMVQLFRDLASDAHRRRGALGLVTVWLGAAADLAVSAARLHRDERRGRAAGRAIAPARHELTMRTPTSLPFHVSGRTAAWSLTLGLAFALMNGLVDEASGSAEPGSYAADVSPSVWMPVALIGLLLGLALGGLIGMAWGRSRKARFAAAVLTVMVGIVTGALVGGRFGMQTSVTVVGDVHTLSHGASPSFVVAGAAAGLVLGLVVAWRAARSWHVRERVVG